MKFFKITIFSTLAIIILIFSCKKEIKNSVENRDTLNNEFGIPPNTVSNINSNIELYNQLKHLASGFSSLFSNNSVNVFGRDALTNLLTQNIPSNDEELKIETFQSLVSNNFPINGFAFSINGNLPINPNSNDLYDALFYCKSTYSTNPATMPAWIIDFYSNFTISGQNYYTLFRIPEISEQGNYPNSLSTPIIFIPENVFGTDDYIGYTFSNNTINTITLNDNIVEDHIDNNTGYVIIIGFEKVNDGSAGGRASSSCEGGYNCLDDYCDEKCGEPSYCSDCASDKNKSLFLTEIKIENDERIRLCGCATVEGRHFQGFLMENMN